MKPDFALVLSPDGIELLHRIQRGWTFLGRVDLDDPALRRKLADLRQTAVDLAPKGLASKLILPESQVLFTAIPSPGTKDSDRVAAVRATLDGMTPYSLDELAFDWEAEGDVLHVAVVARETLAEAEAFAVEHRFNPVSFVTRPKGGSFTGEPYFGETRLAETLNGKAGRVKRDVGPTIVTLRAPRVQAVEPEAIPPALTGPDTDAAAGIGTAESRQPDDKAADAPIPAQEQVGTVSTDAIADEVQASDVPEPRLTAPAAADATANSIENVAETDEDVPPSDATTSTPTAADSAPAAPSVEATTTQAECDSIVPPKPEGPTVPDSPEPERSSEDVPAAAATPTGTVISPVLVETVADFAESSRAPLSAFATRRTVKAEVAAARSRDVASEGFSSRLGSLIGKGSATASSDRESGGGDLVTEMIGAPQATAPAARLGAIVGSAPREAAPLASPTVPAPPKLGAATPGVRRPIPPVPPSKIVGIRKAMAAQSARASRSGKAAASSGTAGGALPEARRQGAASPQRGKPRYVGLMLTAGLLAVLGAVGIWSAVFGPEPGEPVVNATPELAGPAELTVARTPASTSMQAELATDADPSLADAQFAQEAPVLPTETAELPTFEEVAPAVPSGLTPGSEPPIPATEPMDVVEAPDVSTAVDDVAIAAGPMPDAEDRVSLDGSEPAIASASDAPPVADLSTMDASMTAAGANATPQSSAPSGAAAEPLPPAPIISAAPPESPTTPEADAIEGIYLASRDPSFPIAPGPSLAADAAVVDGSSLILLPPPLPGIVYDFDEAGLVRPTVEGAPTPSGTVVFLGRPPLVPPARPEPAREETSPPQLQVPSEPSVDAVEAASPFVASEPDALAEDAPLALPGVPATRPRPRPSDLRGSIDPGLVVPVDDAANEVAAAALAGVAPRARPGLPAVSPILEKDAPAGPEGTQDVIAGLAEALQAVPAETDTSAATLGDRALALVDSTATPDPATVSGPTGAPAGALPLALIPGPADPRPRLRPQRLVETIAAQEAERVAQAAAAAAAIAAASDLAVATSPEPRPRPAGFGERAMRIARSNEANAVAAAATAAAASVSSSQQAAAAAQPTRAPDPEAEADGEDEVQVASAPAASGNIQLPSRASVATQATQQNAIRLNEINLIGIFGSANDRRALVRLPTGRFVRVEVGARLDGGRVAAITDRELRYEKGGRTYTLRVAQRS